MLDMIDGPDAPTTDLATLPPAERASLVLNSTKTEADLKQLAEGLKAITLVNSPAGRDQAHALAMTARGARTAIEKAGKAARDDATKFSKAVIAEEDRLIKIIQPEEIRVLDLRNAWDAAEAARKEAEAQKERDRIAAHQAVITQIKSYPGLARECRTSAIALQMLEKLTAIDINGLEEFKDAAHAAKIAADEQINDIIDLKENAEAEAARIKAEQEAEAARLAEQARVQAEQQAELLAMQARMKAQQEELDRQAAELAARKAEAEKPAQVLADDPREAMAQILPDGLKITPIEPIHLAISLSTSPPHMTGIGLVQTPATVEDANEISMPSAISMINATALSYAIEPAIAIRWLAIHADEFKRLNQIAKVAA
jgi:hypothetical protein